MEHGFKMHPVPAHEAHYPPPKQVLAVRLCSSAHRRLSNDWLRVNDLTPHIEARAINIEDMEPSAAGKEPTHDLKDCGFN